MALHFEHRAAGRPSRIAIFPGAWNPPTVGHLAVADAARRWADEVVWLLPCTFPHKGFEGATFDDRRAMLRDLAAAYPGFSAAVSDNNLHFRMAQDARESYGPGPEIGIICGRDAAERIAGWDYGEPGVFERMLAEHPLLVAARQGEFEPKPQYAPRIHSLKLRTDVNQISSTDIRERIAQSLEWEHLVPEVLVPHAARIYRVA